MTSVLETTFSQTISCQIGFPTIFSFKDLFYVPVALIHFHVDLLLGSLLHRLYLFEALFKVLYSELCSDSGFHYRTLVEVFLS